jgi:DNA-binding GntR family transcriptional regulator
MVDTVGAEAWQRAHAQLLEKERHLEQVVVRHAKGAVTTAELAALQAETERLRQAANAMFNAVFRFYEQ